MIKMSRHYITTCVECEKEFKSWGPIKCCSQECNRKYQKTLNMERKIKEMEAKIESLEKKIEKNFNTTLVQWQVFGLSYANVTEIINQQLEIYYQQYLVNPEIYQYTIKLDNINYLVDFKEMSLGKSTLDMKLSIRRVKYQV